MRDDGCVGVRWSLVDQSPDILGVMSHSDAMRSQGIFSHRGHDCELLQELDALQPVSSVAMTTIRVSNVLSDCADHAATPRAPSTGMERRLSEFVGLWISMFWRSAILRTDNSASLMITGRRELIMLLSNFASPLQPCQQKQTSRISWYQPTITLM